ncbi:MAG: hypothetical protein P8179_10820 [Candidatus Thiodiazotropha sp.]
MLSIKATGRGSYKRTRLQRSDGYAYFPQPAIALNKKETARQAA